MSDKSENNDNSFEYKLREVSDQEIISILQYRDHFNPIAVKAAIKEALKRGIISSIEDLKSDEFQPKETSPRSLFPLGTTKKHTYNIFRSLCRVFYGFGLLPVIYAITQLLRHNLLSGITSLIIGATIIFVVNRLEKTFKPFYSSLLMGLNIPVIGYAIYFLTSIGTHTTMDAFAISIVIFVMLYTTFYLNKLSSYFNKTEENE